MFDTVVKSLHRTIRVRITVNSCIERRSYEVLFLLLNEFPVTFQPLVIEAVSGTLVHDPDACFCKGMSNMIGQMESIEKNLSMGKDIFDHVHIGSIHIHRDRFEIFLCVSL